MWLSVDLVKLHNPMTVVLQTSALIICLFWIKFICFICLDFFFTLFLPFSFSNFDKLVLGRQRHSLQKPLELHAITFVVYSILSSQHHQDEVNAPRVPIEVIIPLPNHYDNWCAPQGRKPRCHAVYLYLRPVHQQPLRQRGRRAGRWCPLPAGEPLPRCASPGKPQPTLLPACRWQPFEVS